MGQRPPLGRGVGARSRAALRRRPVRDDRLRARRASVSRAAPRAARRRLAAARPRGPPRRDTRGRGAGAGRGVAALHHQDAGDARCGRGQGLCAERRRAADADHAALCVARGGSGALARRSAGARGGPATRREPRARGAQALQSPRAGAGAGGVDRSRHRRSAHVQQLRRPHIRHHEQRVPGARREALDPAPRPLWRGGRHAPGRARGSGEGGDRRRGAHPRLRGSRRRPGGLPDERPDGRAPGA